MAKFLTTKGVSYYIENIIRNAKSDLILVSPYLQLSKTFYERLKDATNRGVRIKLIYGKDELKPNEKNSLAELNTLSLLYFENLHAKCYFNESEMVITSMNMYEYSEVNNREMGILIDKKEDKELFDSALEETHSILKSADPILLQKANRTNFQVDEKKVKHVKEIRGHCIRCQTRIKFDPTIPYCSDCFSSWAKYENPDYQECVCHRCGEYESTTMTKPLDYECFLIWQKENRIS